MKAERTIRREVRRLRNVLGRKVQYGLSDEEFAEIWGMNMALEWALGVRKATPAGRVRRVILDGKEEAQS